MNNDSLKIQFGLKILIVVLTCVCVSTAILTRFPILCFLLVSLIPSGLVAGLIAIRLDCRWLFGVSIVLSSFIGLLFSNSFIKWKPGLTEFEKAVSFSWWTCVETNKIAIPVILLLAICIYVAKKKNKAPLTDWRFKKTESKSPAWSVSVFADGNHAGFFYGFVFLSSPPRIRRRLNIPAPHAAEHLWRVPTSSPRESLRHPSACYSRRNLFARSSDSRQRLG